MNRSVKLNEILKEIKILGVSSSPNDEMFASQEMDTRGGFNLTKISEDKLEGKMIEESEFSPKNTIVFDSVARLDSTIMTERGLVGFITITLGAIKFTNGKEITFSDSVKSETERIIIAPRDLFPKDLTHIEISDRIIYTIFPQGRNYIRTYEELWKEIFLEEYLPKIENNFIGRVIIKEIDEDTIFIKDGRLEIYKDALPYEIQNENLWFNIFGNIKNYQVDINEIMLDIISGKSKRTQIEYENYSKINAKRYQSYINLGKLKNGDREVRHEVFKKGIFNLSRIDMIIPEHLENIPKLIGRYNFISNYMRKMTSIFSNNPRFPQNLPIISSLEKYLRSLMGKREIIIKELMSNY